MNLRRIILILLTVQAEILAAHLGLAHGVAPMLVVMIEGFDHMITAAALTAKGWTIPVAGGSNAFPTGRFSPGQAFQLTATGAGVPKTATKQLPSTYTTLYAGFAFQYSTIGTAAAFFAMQQSSGIGVLNLRLNASGKILVLNSSNTTIATGTTTLAANTWYYIEVECVVNGASGSCTLKLNGVSEIATTTGNFGSTAIDRIFMSSTTGASASTNYDDMYVLDSTGSLNNTFLGDRRVYTLFPDGDGAHTQFTPTGGGSHYTQVDDSAPDDDTTYVSDANVGDIDTYTFQDIDGAATVNAVQVNTYARKDDVSTRQIAPVRRRGGTDYVGATVTLASGYAYYSQLDNQDPTSANWTAANVNNDEVGVKVIA